MRRKELQGDEAKPDSTINHILSNGQGIPVSLSEAPTTDGGQLKGNEWGHYDGTLYINLGGTIYSIALTEV